MIRLPRVIIESPLSGADFAERWRERIGFRKHGWWWDLFERIGRAANKRYAVACCRHSVLIGEAPYASHLFFDREHLLDDSNEYERKLGMEAGFSWGEAAELRVFYVDCDVSGGMIAGLREAKRLGQRIEMRRLYGHWDTGIPLAARAVELVEACDRQRARSQSS